MIPITIVIIEDHTLLREAWRLLFSTNVRFKVLADYDNAEVAIEAVKQLAPDIILLDINLPGINGIEALPLILHASPSSKVISISQHAHPSYVSKIMKQGAMGYVSKNSSKNEVIEAILTVYSNKKFICTFVKQTIAERFTSNDSLSEKLNSLTQRELEVIELIRKGFTSKEIAEAISISLKTVEVHRYNILKKLGLKKTTSLLSILNKH